MSCAVKYSLQGFYIKVSIYYKCSSDIVGLKDLLFVI
jgi:hypothetical protein